MDRSRSITSLTVVATTSCNLRCSYCYLRVKRQRSISWDSLQTALGLLSDTSARTEVLFTGGEPLLALPTVRRAVSFLEETRAAHPGIHFEIVTNGLLLNDEAVDFLDAHGFLVHLSFDGIAPAQSARGRGTFAKLDALLDRLRRNRPSFFDRLHIAMTVSPETVRHLVPSVEYFLARGVRTVKIGPSVPATCWRRDGIRELDAQFDRVAATAKSHMERTGMMPLTLFRTRPGDGEKGAREWICGAARTDGVTLDVDGHACGCIVASSSYQPRTPLALRDAVDALALGRVDAPAFPERLASMPSRARACGAYTHPEERYSRYRRCRDCEYLGRCYACPLAGAPDPEWDDTRRVPDFVCAWNQVTLAHQDRFAAQRV